MTADVKACIAGIDALSERMDHAMHDITTDALKEVRLWAAFYAPVGTPGNTTNPPGDLKRSFDIEAPVGGHGLYVGRVGPTTIYARQRELGGHIYPKRAKYLRFVKFGEVVYTRHVYQRGQFYTKRGRATAIPWIEKKTIDTIAVAIKSG